jgi:nucleoside-diphosphate kinase
VLSLGNLGWKPNLVNQPNSPTKLEYSMSIEQTLSIIKPDAVGKNVIGKIMDRFESAGLKIVACRMVHLSREQAETFYAVHKDRPFYGELVEYMISGAVIIQILEGEEAIQRNRDVMGATNPTEAAPGTIRADFAESVQANAVHGSDSPTTAQQEISYFFDPAHISSRN